jgi:hypothetical protein
MVGVTGHCRARSMILLDCVGVSAIPPLPAKCRQLRGKVGGNGRHPFPVDRLGITSPIAAPSPERNTNGPHSPDSILGTLAVRLDTWEVWPPLFPQPAIPLLQRLPYGRVLGRRSGSAAYLCPGLAGPHSVRPGAVLGRLFPRHRTSPLQLSNQSPLLLRVGDLEFLDCPLDGALLIRGNDVTGHAGWGGPDSGKCANASLRLSR